MQLSLTVLPENNTESAWVESLKQLTSGFEQIKPTFNRDAQQAGDVVFISEKREDLDHLLELLNQKNAKAVFLISEDEENIPQAIMEGKADDVLVYPFRPVEVLSKLRLYQQLVRWEEMNQLNQSFSNVVGKLQEDLALAERLQKRRFPAKLTNPSGFQVESRYYAGLKAGGDYFDLIPEKETGDFTVLLTDASTYGLSSAVLAALMRVAGQFVNECGGSPKEMLKKLHEELASTLGEKDQLSLFFAFFQKNSLLLNYYNLGTAAAFHAPSDGKFTRLKPQGDALSLNFHELPEEDYQVQLSPKDRLVLTSDGFIEAVGGEDQILENLNESRHKEAKDVLNELGFMTNRGLEEDDMPSQDSTALVFDVEGNILRLA